MPRFGEFAIHFGPVFIITLIFVPSLYKKLNQLGFFMNNRKLPCSGRDCFSYNGIR